MSDCYCDYDAPEFYFSRRVRARKVHRCAECGTRIDEGDDHEYVAGKWCGDFGTVRTCAACVDLRQWVSNNLPCFCWAHHNVIEDAHNAIEEARWRAPEETRGLAFGFGRRLVAIRHRVAQQARAA